MNEPEFIICLECNTPCYDFDWDQRREKIAAAQCQACGNDEVDEFEIGETG